MSRYYARFSLALVAVMPWAATAQTNASLIGSDGMSPNTPVAEAVPVTTGISSGVVSARVSGPAKADPSTSLAVDAVQREGMGDTTRSLLSLQAGGQMAGGELPILGAVSTASWNRYVDSFKQPIPLWFAEKVDTSK